MEERYLFRGRLVDNGEWVYGTGVTDFLNVYPNENNKLWLWSDYSWVEIDPATLGQCTGHKYIDDSLMFEGNRAKFHCMAPSSNMYFDGMIGTVQWCDDRLLVVFDDFLSMPVFQEVDQWEKVGTIHDDEV